MPNQKLTLEDILNEYSPDKNDELIRVNKVETTSDDMLPPPRLKIAPTSHEKAAWNDETLKQPNPDTRIQPSDDLGKRISVIKNDPSGTLRTISIQDDSSALVQSIPDFSEPTKIRRMKDSTRAKEAEALKKNKRKRKRKTSNFTYERETPDGEYVYTPPSFKKKKRSRREVLAEAERFEGRKSINDIVPSPAYANAAMLSENTAKTKRNGVYQNVDSDIAEHSIDIDEAPQKNEYRHSNKKRTKRIVDFNYYGDVEDVGKDIEELKSTISVRVIILCLTAFLSLYITIFNQFGLPITDILSQENTLYYLAAHLTLGLISVFSSMTVITKGIKKLFTMKADSDSLTAITTLSCIIAMIPGIFQPDVVQPERIYMPVGILALLTNSIGKLLIMKRASRNFKLVSKEFDRHGITYVHDEDRAERLTRGTIGDFPILASMRRTDFLTDFLKYSYSSDITDQYCRKVTPACLIVSILISIVLTVFCKDNLITVDSAHFGFSIFSMLICATSCIAMPFVANIPLENISMTAYRNKGIMLGYQSVDDFYDTNSILVTTETLFPMGTVQLDGIKVFSNTKLDEAFLEAASLTHHAESIMYQLFDDVTIGKPDALYNVENYSNEEGMGLCGWIKNRRVLFGNRELMVSHNIEGLPTKVKEAEYADKGQEIMYLSISGNLAAMFTVNIKGDRQIRKWAKKLCKHRIFMILKSVDPCISLKKISQLFGIPEEMVRIIPKKLHDDFDAETKKTTRLSASMACSGKFSSLAQLIIGTKAVHSAAIVGLIFQTVSILLGFVLCSLIILSKAFAESYVYMSATAIVMYNIACGALTYFAVSLKNI